MFKFALGFIIGGAVVYTLMDPDGQEMLTKAMLDTQWFAGEVQWRGQAVYNDVIDWIQSELK